MSYHIRRKELLQRLEERAFFQSLEPALTALRTDEAELETLLPDRLSQAMQQFARLPVVDERVNWLEVPDSRICTWGNDAERRAFLQAALGECASAWNSLFIIWNGHSMPGLRIKPDTLLRHCNVILDQHSETWIIGHERNSGWLIECSLYDKQLCWAKWQSDAEHHSKTRRC